MTAGLQAMWPACELPSWDTHFSAKAAYQLDRYIVAVGLTSNHKTALDVGAHVGLISRYMVFDFGRVVAFEPSAELARLCEKNVPRARVFHCGLSDATRMGGITLGKDSNSGSGYFEEAPGGRCTVRELDGFVFPDVGLIKIDVQGHELQVLQGARQTIGRDKPTIWCEGEPGCEAETWLRDHGASIAGRLGQDFFAGWNDFCRHAAGQ